MGRTYILLAPPFPTPLIKVRKKDKGKKIFMEKKVITLFVSLISFSYRL